jgi:hypothetical protein
MKPRIKAVALAKPEQYQVVSTSPHAASSNPELFARWPPGGLRHLAVANRAVAQRGLNEAALLRGWPMGIWGSSREPFGDATRPKWRKRPFGYALTAYADVADRRLLTN